MTDEELVQHVMQESLHPQKDDMAASGQLFHVEDFWQRAATTATTTSKEEEEAVEAALKQSVDEATQLAKTQAKDERFHQWVTITEDCGRSRLKKKALEFFDPKLPFVHRIGVESGIVVSTDHKTCTATIQLTDGGDESEV